MPNTKDFIFSNTALILASFNDIKVIVIIKNIEKFKKLDEFN